ncbi:MAG: PhnD/SsuA/transferrin family substrate-binding protein [Actinomycetota bacterium]|jgi:phosphonate transport system substrate-binding protein|nr:PhnD/SsuA/transferrin family substrate-binding protein [Actinomycetota bacterium]HWS82241.1 PhnD/SsuA/transferrin family substrate-binding protein [Rubrobacter sp.]
MAADGDIRFVTYLSPSIPRALFEALADHVQRTLGHEEVSLRVESKASGPQNRGECSSFAEEADVAFMCAPSFVWLRDLRPPPAELLGVLPVFDDERNQGKPVYFCDVVVRNDAPIQAFSGLEGGTWAYNDACSLSGYYSLFDKLAESSADESFFDNIFCSGSHLNSIEAVLNGRADAAAIDSNVLRIRFREAPTLRKELRVVESWGPYPIQPVVVSSALRPDLKQRLRSAFLSTEQDQQTRRTLQQFGLSRFVAADQRAYSFDAHKDLAVLLAAR